jgi:hypothetical protein
MNLPQTGLYNGIFLQTKEFNAEMHNLDTGHLLRMNSQTDRFSDSTDLGMIIPWITTGFMERNGIWDMINTKQGVKRTMIDGHIARFQYPIASQPTKLLKDISNTETPGIDGTTFKILSNKRSFGNGAIITPDKHLALELVVTPDEITGNPATGFVYTVRMNSTNGKYKYFPKEMLQAGTIYFRTGSIGSEFSSTYDSLAPITSGFKEYYLHVGEGHAHKSFSVTRDAAYSQVSGHITKSLQEYRQVCEMYQFAPGSPASDAYMRGTSPIDVYMNHFKTDKAAAMGLVKKDIVKKAYIPLVEAIAMMEVERDVDYYAIWGSGGTMKVDGKTEVNLPIGLFHQFNLGSYASFNIPKFTLERLEALLLSRLKDKIDPYGVQEMTIGCGAGALKLIRTQIRNRFLQANMITQAKDYIKGADNQKLYLDTQNFMSYRWEYGILNFTHVPAFDPIVSNEYNNPMYDGHRLSSYMMVIDDLSGEGGNVEELVYGADWDFNHFYTNGKLAYEDMGGRPHHGNKDIPGFEVYVEKKLKAYRLVDPTKSLIIKPINPFTGKMIFEPVY